MFQLSNLAPLTKKRKRVGRGGKLGGTSGRGHKGQKARSGHSKNPSEFEGGQMPLTRRIPKRGFTNPFSTEYAVVNLASLEALFANNDTVDRAQLVEKGIIKKSDKSLIKVLGNGELHKSLTLHVDAISASAKKAVEERGGQVHLIKER